MHSRITRIVLVTMVAATMVGCSVKVKNEKPVPIDARPICQGFVKDKMTGVTPVFGHEAETGTYPTFTSTGRIDYIDQTGARVRKHYTCIVTYHPSSGDWTLDILSGLDA